MKSFEYKVLRGLLFCTILLFNYNLLMSLFSSFVAPRDFSNSSHYMGFIVTFVGLHSFFGLIAFGTSRIQYKQKSSYLMVSMSVVVPIYYLFHGLNQFSDSNISFSVIVLMLLVLYDFFKRDFKGNIIKKYFKVLTDPNYLAEDDYPF